MAGPLVETLYRCARCGESKPASGFHWTRRGRKGSPSEGKLYRQSPCRSCHRKDTDEWKARNPSKLRVYQRRSLIKRKYGLTDDQYNAMVKAQGGLCAVCRGPTKTGKPLSVDHDHKTGKVRGLLCERCNFAIGHAQDDPAVLRRLADYLEAT